LTRWDVYKSEVESSYLKWGIVHNEKFFKENVRRMEGIDGNFQIVKVSDDMGGIRHFDDRSHLC
jgi:hypothetical protein